MKKFEPGDLVLATTIFDSSNYRHLHDQVGLVLDSPQPRADRNHMVGSWILVGNSKYFVRNAYLERL